MDNPNAAYMSSVVSIAQILLRKEQDKGNEITPLLIAKKLDTAALTDPDADFDKAAAIDELVRRFSHWVGKESTLKSTFDHLDWLDSERKKDWRYWGRLQRYLEHSLSINVVEDHVVNAVTCSAARNSTSIREPRAHDEATGNVAHAAEAYGHVGGFANRTLIILILRRQENGETRLRESSPYIFEDVVFEQDPLSVLKFEQVLDDKWFSRSPTDEPFAPLLPNPRFE